MKPIGEILQEKNIVLNTLDPVSRDGFVQIPNFILKDPSLLKPGAKSYADLPGGHSEGYDDSFKQIFRRFYQSIADPTATPEYPQFVDGLRQLTILEAEMESNAKHGWADVPPFQG